MKKLNDDPKFINRLYNYCDHWCERCPFTSRCMNFALNNKHVNDQKSRDISNEAFWQRLSKSLKQTRDLLEDTAKQKGINFAAINANKILANKEISDEFVRSHVCCRMAKTYTEIVDNWFDLVGDISEQIEKGTDVTSDFELPHLRSKKGTSLEDALQIIRWYQNQIYIKLMRAVRSGLEEAPKISDDFARDSDGSAKVALIAIDRSIAAWGEIRNHYPLNDDKIMELLRQLGQLNNKVEAAFPDARAFVRPGFDKIDLNG
jgi:hypothetical protein